MELLRPGARRSLQESKMTTAATFYKREAEAVERKRALAPETVKLADLLWAFAERQPAGRYEAVALVASTVQTWADNGRNVDAAEVLAVLEAAFKLSEVIR
jgi:hypothetical protein